MARYLGPTCKLSRREKTDLGLKSGIRPLESKCKLDTPPGMHGKRGGRLSDYGVQIRMKQLIRRYYGILEKQFRRYYQEADRLKGSTSYNLLRLLESRLDNVVYRLGFASTRAEARQLVSHGTVSVNGGICRIPSRAIKPNDIVTIREKAKSQLRIKAALELSRQRPECEWLELNEKDLSGLLKRYPDEEEFPRELKPELVIELYSK